TAALAADDFTASSGTLLSNYLLPTAATGTGTIMPRGDAGTTNDGVKGTLFPDRQGFAVMGDLLLDIVNSGVRAPSNFDSDLNGCLLKLGRDTGACQQQQ
ncbi:MAG: hypothetical protein ORN49_10645, partial [Rhodobacteraceae bacterium]|nr:hypothetical protein [Paracoccaceae bacterium]